MHVPRLPPDRSYAATGRPSPTSGGTKACGTKLWEEWEQSVLVDLAATEVRSLSTQLGFTRVGHIKLSKSDISDFDWERVGVRGYSLSIGPNPSPGLRRTMLRIAGGNPTSPDGRGKVAVAQDLL